VTERPPQLGELIDVAGAFDLHVHSYPSLFPRLADDLGLAEAYAAAGFAGFALKSHHESTASRAYLLGRLHPELRVAGGIVLNGFVGGINPSAVEACLRTGGRIVWMPTIDAQGMPRRTAARAGTRPNPRGWSEPPRGCPSCAATARWSRRCTRCSSSCATRALSSPPAT
jgi:hypothetical protein